MGGIYNSRNLQTYHYAGNNPLKYVDPTGEVIVLNNKNMADRQALVDDINSMSVTQYKLGGFFGNKLVIDQKATEEMKRKIANGQETRSQSFTNDIETLRNSKVTTSIKIAETEKEISEAKEAGGGYTRHGTNGRTGGAGGVVIVVARDGRSTFSNHEDGSSRTRQDILLHEISGHATPFIEHDADSDKGKELNAIDIENERRKELGKSPRHRERYHNAYTIIKPAE